MSSMYGSVEVRWADEWSECVDIASLLLTHLDLSGCLFGVDNLAGFRPLFAGRGLPSDVAFTLGSKVNRGDGLLDASWVLWSELRQVDWNERAETFDARVSEIAESENGDVVITKWLTKPELAWIKESLERNPEKEVRIGERRFRRLILRRRDALEGTEFPLLMRLMECLAERFGGEGVRLTVYFG